MILSQVPHYMRVYTDRRYVQKLVLLVRLANWLSKTWSQNAWKIFYLIIKFFTDTFTSLIANFYR